MLRDEGTRLEAVVAPLTPHVAVRQPAELRIDDWRQLAEGALVSVTPGAEELADIVHRHGSRFPWALDDCRIVLPPPNRRRTILRHPGRGRAHRAGFCGVRGFDRPRRRGCCIQGNARGAHWASVRFMPSSTTAILPMFPADAARLSGRLFSEVRAAERPCAKHQQQATYNNEYEGHVKAGQEMRQSIRSALEEQSIHNSHRK